MDLFAKKKIDANTNIKGILLSTSLLSKSDYWGEPEKVECKFVKL
jgi:hypothetical protein